MVKRRRDDDEDVDYSPPRRRGKRGGTSEGNHSPADSERRNSSANSEGTDSSPNLARAPSFFDFPAEIRNLIYEQMLANFKSDNHDSFITMREAIPFNAQPEVEDVLTNADNPVLFMNDPAEAVFFDPDPDWEDDWTEYWRRDQIFGYMRHDLVMYGHVSQQFRHEYRAYQREHLDFFVISGLLPEFIQFFYPPTTTNYHGKPFTVMCPSQSKKTASFFPLLQLLAASPQLSCDVWAYQHRVILGPIGMEHTHQSQIREGFFAPENSLRSYLATRPPMLLPPHGIIKDVRFRSHGDLYDRRARLVITFDRDLSLDQSWLDNKLWVWSDPNNPYLSARERNRTHRIVNFLQSINLDHFEILESWEFQFNVARRQPTRAVRSVR